MSSTTFTVDDLRRLLREGAGADEGIDLDGDILDQDFAALGYDSLALLETGARILREYQVRLDDSVIASARTPRELVEAVNATAPTTSV